MMSSVAMSVNYDSFTNLVRYPQLLATRHLSWQAKCTYIPLVSSVKGLIEIILVAAKVSLFLVSAVIGFPIFGAIWCWSVSANDNRIMILNIFNLPGIVACSIYPLDEEVFDELFTDLSTLVKGLIQQVPVIGNAVLASYDIKKYQV